MTRIPLHIPVDHPAFAGHFPGRPIVPGVLLLDMCQTVVEQLAGRRVTGLAAAKFVSPVTPGEAVTADVDLTPAEARFTLQAGPDGQTRTVASGRMRLAETGGA